MELDLIRVYRKDMDPAPGCGAPAPRFMALDVNNFKAYNTLFGYESATQILDDLVKYVKSLKSAHGIGIVEVLRVGGDEFLVALGVDDAVTEIKLTDLIARYAPVQCTIAFGSSESVALQTLEVESYLKKKSGLSHPLSRRNTSTSELEMSLCVIDAQVHSPSNNLQLVLDITLFWKDARLKQLPCRSADTFGMSEPIWSPNLTVGDMVHNEIEQQGDKSHIRTVSLTRTINQEWQKTYMLRARAIKEAVWCKTTDSLTPQECESGVSHNALFVFGSDDNPYKYWNLSRNDTSWQKRQGFVRTGKEPASLPTDLPRAATSQDLEEHGFVKYVGFHDEARTHMQLNMMRSSQSAPNMFFPYDYIEDCISFFAAPTERDLRLVWQGHAPNFVHCAQCSGKHVWTIDGQGKSVSLPTGDSATDACVTQRNLNGFSFEFTFTVKKQPLNGEAPCVHVKGWRDSGFYRVRLQWPLTIVTFITGSVFMYDADEFHDQVTTILTSFVVLASMLILTSKFVQTKDVTTTILDLQILINTFYLLTCSLVLIGCSHARHGHIAEGCKPANGSAHIPSICEARLALSVKASPICSETPFWVFSPMMLVFNIVFTCNPCNLAVDLRYYLEKMYLQMIERLRKFTTTCDDNHLEAMSIGSHYCNCTDCKVMRLHNVWSKIRDRKSNLIRKRARKLSGGHQSTEWPHQSTTMNFESAHSDKYDVPDEENQKAHLSMEVHPHAEPTLLTNLHACREKAPGSNMIKAL